MLKMFMGAFAISALVVTAASTHAADDGGPCKIATKGDNGVVKACKEGGIKKAKGVMKAMTKIAKQKGMKTDCDSCHKNETDWALTENGEKDFQKMLELVK